MKRLLTSAALFLCSLMTFAQFSGSGSGTEDDPYLIFNETQLSQMANFLNQDSVVFRLMNNLNLTNWINSNSPTQGWQPIGVESSPFKGKLLGNNKTITGLTINRQSASYVGFFGKTDGAIIENLTIKGSSVKGKQYVGGFGGMVINSTISNVNIELTSGVVGETYVGGFGGQITGSTINTISATANVSGTQIIGGAFGSASESSFTGGTITGFFTASDGKIGGVIGTVSGCELQDISSTGNVTANGDTGHAAGAIAVVENIATLTNCAHYGDVTGKTIVSGCVSSIQSGSSVTFASCSSKGKLTNEGDYTGGMVAVSYGLCLGSMDSCSHFGDIDGTNHVGGMIGAVVNAERPILHTYVVKYSDSSYSNGNAPNSTGLTESISYSSEVVSATLNNCAAIGNINGNNYVGGMIGSDQSGYTYIPEQKTTKLGPTNWHYLYLWKDGEYTGVYTYFKSYNSSNGLTITYYDYTRKTAFLNITNNYYSGKINGAEQIGGIAGKKATGEIIKNYAYGNIIGASNVGGVVGNMAKQEDNTLTVKSNIAICSTISATTANVGRIYGSVEDADLAVIGAVGSADGNRALTLCKVILQGVVQEVEDNLQHGSTIGPDLLRLKATYVAMGWDMNNNWNILETECFPYKKYQAAPPVIESSLVSQATNISGKSIDGGTVYLYYKDRNAVSTECTGNVWSFTTEPLQSGAQVQIYADVEGLTPSYFTTTNVGYPGSGTEDDPYRIYTAEDLQGASNRGYYQVMNDINLTTWIAENSPEKGWVPIGRNSGDATYIDGAGHTISGLWTNTTEDYTGLFSNYSAGQIKNLTVEVANGKSVKGGNYTGILIGRMANGTILNCQVKGNVEGTKYVGGITGYSEANILTTLSFDGTVKATAEDACVGGIVGHAKSSPATNCTAYATINATNATANAGGLMGLYEDGRISKSLVDVAITATGANSNVGGLVGYLIGDVQISLSKGNVSATGAGSNTGGLVGYAKNSAIVNNYSTANVNGTDFTAGLVGYAYATTIDKCYAKGDITGVQYGAGVVGELEAANATLTNSVAVSNILSLTAQSSWGSRVIGGFKSGAPTPDESNYALTTMQVSLNNIPQSKTDDLVEGIAKTETELKQAATYQNLGWDFSTIWGIDEGEIYPYLLWEVDVNPVADISFDKTSLLIAVGKTETITANILPLGATNKRLDWTTSNANIATVSDGEVTAVAVGTTTITATATDGSGVSATCQVTVVANHDAAIAELQSLVDQAQELYNNSTEGENIGEYATGSRAALLAVIRSVRARISSTMTDEAINECTSEISDAIAQFESQQVTAGEDTDYSQIDNTLYIERVEASAGGQVQLSIKMKNTVEVQGYQFDLYLPESVTIATDEDGFPMAELSTERTTERKTDYFNCSMQSDGSLRVLCGSSKGYTFSGSDGEVAIITLTISSNIEEGEHPIIMKNIRLSDKGSVPYVTNYLKSTLVISSYTLGDVNADGSVDVADFIAVANHILGNTPEVFVYKAADVNVDNSIDVADFIGIANMILNGATSANQSHIMMAPRKAGNLTLTDIDALSNAIYVEPVTANPGTQQVLSVKMKNVDAIAGFEFNLQLPDGITVATDEDGLLMAELSTERTTTRKTDYFNSSIQQDGTLKVLCGSSTPNPQTGKVYTFSGNDGEVARITVNIPEGYNAGEYAIHILNGILADADSHKTELEADITSLLTIEEMGDGRIHFAETDTSLPSFTFGEKADVTVTRTINANEWSTICLPFGMTAEQIEDAFPETNVQLADFIGCSEPELDDEEEVMSFSFKFSTNVAEIEPNHPYLIKVDKKVESFEVDGVTLTPSDELSIDLDEIKWKQGGKWYYDYNSFIGTYEAQTVVPEDCLFLNGNNFWYSTGATKMKAFRGYFYSYNVLGDAYKNGANSNVSLSFNDADGILNVKVGDMPTEGTYDLQGRKVTGALKRGIYIVDGKKMVIK